MKRWLKWLLSLAAMAAIALGAFWFQPWRLFTNVEVVEALPSQTASASAKPAPSESQEDLAEPEVPAEPVVLLEGSLISHEYETSGSVRVLQLPDGSRVLRLEGLETSDGPDLEVWLSDAAVVPGVDGWHLFDDGEYFSLGKLKGNLGDQNYEIPADLDLERFSSMSIWCVRFAVSFGAAELS